MKAVSEPPPSRRTRLRRLAVRALASVIAALALIEVFNVYMYFHATGEARMIALDHDYATAFKTIDYLGKGDVGVVLFHNLHGTPQDFELLMKELRDRDISFYAPMLGGESPAPAIQNGFTPETLEGHAEQAYQHLARRCERIIVVGASVGALQAVDVAGRHDVEGLVLVSPAFRIGQRRWLIPSTEFWARAIAPLTPLVPKGKSARINDPEAAATHRGFRTMATGGVVALLDYTPRVLARLDSITAPMFCILSRSDDVIDLDAAESAVRRIASPEKRFQYFNKANHTILSDFGRDEATRSILSFIRDLLPASDAEPEP